MTGGVTRAKDALVREFKCYGVRDLIVKFRLIIVLFNRSRVRGPRARVSLRHIYIYTYWILTIFAQKWRSVNAAQSDRNRFVED